MDRTSLVVVEAGEDGQPRLAMLDSVREFAAEHIPRATPWRRSNSATRTYFVTYAERAAEAGGSADRRMWLGRLARERGNLRVAFERLLRFSAAADALRIAIAFARALPWDAHAHEVRGWLASGAGARLAPEPSARRAPRCSGRNSSSCRRRASLPPRHRSRQALDSGAGA